MDIDAEIARMKAEGFWFTRRSELYRRKSDGYTVSAVDWPDGDVSWMLEPLPAAFMNGPAWGTCSGKTFQRKHEAV